MTAQPLQHLIIPRDSIETADLSGTVQLFANWAASPQNALNSMGRIVLSVDGYDDDPRALWELPQARRWFGDLLSEVPHILFFLSPEKGSTKFMAFMTCRLKKVRGVKGIAADSAANFYSKSAVAINSFCDRLGIDPCCEPVVDLNQRITDSLLS